MHKNVLILLVLAASVVCAQEDQNLIMINKCRKIILFGEVNQVFDPAIADAIVALGLLGDERSVELIGEVLANHQNDDVRHKCARALGWIRSAKAIPCLEAALGDRYVFVKEAAALSLKLITGKDHAPRYTEEELRDKKKNDDDMARMFKEIEEKARRETAPK